MSELHKHAAVFEAAMQGEADDWEVLSIESAGHWFPASLHFWSFYEYPDNWTSRRKQKTHIVNGFTVPEPLREIPKDHERYFIESSENLNFYQYFKWCGDDVDSVCLKRGIAHATREGAIANCKARLGIDPYKDES